MTGLREVWRTSAPQIHPPVPPIPRRKSRCRIRAEYTLDHPCFVQGLRNGIRLRRTSVPVHLPLPLSKTEVFVRRNPNSSRVLYTPESQGGTSTSHTGSQLPLRMPPCQWHDRAKSLYINKIPSRATLAPGLPLGRPQAPEGWAPDPGGSAHGGPVVFRASAPPLPPRQLHHSPSTPSDAGPPPSRARSLPAPGPPFFLRAGGGEGPRPATCARRRGYSGVSRHRGGAQHRTGEFQG